MANRVEYASLPRPGNQRDIYAMIGHDIDMARALELYLRKLADRANDSVQLGEAITTPSLTVSGAADVGSLTIDSLSGLLLGTSGVVSALPYTPPTTYTPTIQGTTTAGVGTYSTQNGVYLRMGPLAWFQTTVVWSAHTGTGNMRLAGVPLTPNASYVQVIPADTASMTGSTSPALIWTGSEFSIRNAENNTPIALDTAATFVASGWFLL